MNWQDAEDAIAEAYHSPLTKQVNGNHYKNMAIQPIEFIHANKLGYCEGNVVKYITRWRNKNGKADLEKAKHYIDLLIELEGLNAHLDAQEGVNSPPERP